MFIFVRILFVFSFLILAFQRFTASLLADFTAEDVLINEMDFLLKSFLMDSNHSPLWRLDRYLQVCFVTKRWKQSPVG